MAADDDRDRPLHRAAGGRRRRRSRRSGRGTRGARRTRGCIASRYSSVTAPRSLEVGADRPELRLEVADADAEREPPAGQHVEAGDLLGEHDRVALRHDHDAGREADRRRRRGRPRRARSAGRAPGPAGAIGDGGTCGSGSTTCSPAHSESNPAASAARRGRGQRVGPAHGPMLMLNSPSLMSTILAQCADEPPSGRCHRASGRNLGRCRTSDPPPPAPAAERPHMPEYGVDTPDWQPLPWEWAAERLVVNRNYWVVTVSGTGSAARTPRVGRVGRRRAPVAFSCGPRRVRRGTSPPTPPSSSPTATPSSASRSRGWRRSSPTRRASRALDRALRREVRAGLGDDGRVRARPSRHRGRARPGVRHRRTRGRVLDVRHARA